MTESEFAEIRRWLRELESRQEQTWKDFQAYSASIQDKFLETQNTLLAIQRSLRTDRRRRRKRLEVSRARKWGQRTVLGLRVLAYVTTIVAALVALLIGHVSPAGILELFQTIRKGFTL